MQEQKNRLPFETYQQAALHIKSFISTTLMNQLHDVFPEQITFELQGSTGTGPLAEEETPTTTALFVKVSMDLDQQLVVGQPRTPISEPTALLYDSNQLAKHSQDPRIKMIAHRISVEMAREFQLTLAMEPIIEPQIEKRQPLNPASESLYLDLILAFVPTSRVQ